MKKMYFSICLMLVSVFAFSQWVALNSGTTNGLNSCYFTNSSIGYLVGW